MILHYDKTSQITKDQIENNFQKLNDYLIRINKVAATENYTYEESSINLPFDEGILTEVYRLKQTYCSKKPKYILDVGIGGSNLGTKAIYDALYGNFDIVEPDRFPKMLFADTSNPSFLTRLYNFTSQIKNPEDIIVNVISKSGKTTETLVNLEVIAGSMPFIKDRLVITTNYNSDLWRTARSMKIDCLPIPNKVGGRYSVFSSVGLFPLACMDMDLADLLQGAMEARNACIDINLYKNPAVLSAIILFENYKKGKLINDNFFFNSELESLGKWYRQLMSESIGKDGKGITPTVSIGSTDLHSMAQLYLGGIKDKIFTFISANTINEDISVPQDQFMDILSEIENKSAKEIMNAILIGIKTAFAKNEIPFMEIILDNISPNSLGRFMQFKMLEMMYLGKLLDVNSFDQPSVEEYKIETRKILRKDE